jgi:cell shape-determining protein MreC
MRRSNVENLIKNLEKFFSFLHPFIANYLNNQLYFQHSKIEIELPTRLQNKIKQLPIPNDQKKKI